ncbi:hypothetical protein TNCV_282801 [Trichonephila clavipes]|nr:hypothetical protein TNCV_282801 [Trichonephila clavipes]
MNTNRKCFRLKLNDERRTQNGEFVCVDSCSIYLLVHHDIRPQSSHMRLNCGANLIWLDCGLTVGHKSCNPCNERAEQKAKQGAESS